MSKILKLLVVDDEEGMRLGIARALRTYTTRVPYLDEEISFQLATAASAEEALEMVRADRPDLMLLDHKLPGMTGTELLTTLQEQDIRILTIMITAYASLTTAITAIKLGAFDFVAKPFTPTELKASLHKATKHLIAIEQAARLEAEKRKVRFQFMSVLFHELKAPLAAVESYISVLRDPDLAQDPANYQHVIDRCMVRIQGMRKMILDLLDLTHIEAGTKRRSIEPLDLRQIAEISRETIHPEAEKRSIRIDIEAPAQIPFTADHGEMEIIFNNLISNAVKYNRTGGSVKVEIEPDSGGRVRIAVSDTGIGLSPGEASKLFQDFVRIKNAKTRNILGSGLGLSIVRKLAQQYGGDVRVDSTPDVGSTFTVELDQTSAPGDTPSE